MKNELHFFSIIIMVGSLIIVSLINSCGTQRHLNRIEQICLDRSE